MTDDLAYSMTGFGRGEYEDDARGVAFTVEVKSVNHRYCDVSIKTPRGMGYVDNQLRQMAMKYISRGKVDIYVTCDKHDIDSAIIRVDESLADAYHQALTFLKQKYQIDGDISLDGFAQIQGILNVEKKEEDEEMVWGILSVAASNAFDALKNMREKEGVRLVDNVKDRLNIMKSLLSQIEVRTPLIVVDYKNRLLERIKELIDQQDMMPDEGRLAMEVAIFADRSNIDEEIVRLKSHIEQAERCIETDAQVGRKLDFIVQEMNRETNTIGSKSSDLEVSNLSLDMKSEIEKIREQIQNLE